MKVVVKVCPGEEGGMLGHRNALKHFGADLLPIGGEEVEEIAEDLGGH